MKYDARHIPRLYVQLASICGDGMNVELCMGDHDGNLVDGDPYPIMWIRADDEDMKLLVVMTDAGAISMPLSEVERAIDIAKQEVHCESYYDEPNTLPET